MDIYNDKLEQLLLDIEKVRRRKVADYKASDNIEYIDGANNIKKLGIANNHLIFGRRGSGKTSLILASIKTNNGIVTAIDAKPMKQDNTNNIILKVVLNTLSDVQQQFEDYFVNVEKLYRKQYQGVGGIISFILEKEIRRLRSNLRKV